jgi:hypothetical protein
LETPFARLKREYAEGKKASPLRPPAMGGNDPEDCGIGRTTSPVSALYATTSATRIAASLRVSVMRRFDCDNARLRTH